MSKTAMKLPTLFADHSYILWDGGMGTMLIESGLKQGECPELWNVDHKDQVKKIHAAYYEAGSDVVQTNTFGGNRLKLQDYQLQDRVKELNQAAAELVRHVCPEGKFVCGDIGPTGKMLKPMGTFEPQEFTDAFAEQAEGLEAGNVDVFQIETIFSLEEALAALKGVMQGTKKPIIVSMTFSHTPNGFHTIMGETPELCFDRLMEAGATYVATNCTLSSGQMVELVKTTVEKTTLPFMVQPNAGLPKVVNGVTVHDESADAFSTNCKEIYDAGVRILGGCCGTTPEHITAIKNKLS